MWTNLVSRWQYQMSIHDRYKNAHCPEKFVIFWGTKGDHRVKIFGRKRGNKLEVPLVAKRRLIKLEGWLQNQVTALKFFVNLIKLAFLKALTIMRDFTDNTEFNKCRSRLVTTLEKKLHKIPWWVAAVSDRANTVLCKNSRFIFSSRITWKRHYEGVYTFGPMKS